MFILQLLLAFQDVLYVTDDPEILGHDLYLDITWADFRHSSEWLAGVEATRKWDDGYLSFTPGCAGRPGYRYWSEEGLPKCSAWYLLLIGELRLREEPDFTVRTLELCLFALSGSVFLLIVSGNVRSAYFDFYFKWECLKKNQRTSVKVITGPARRAPTSSVATLPTLSTSSRP